MCDVVAISFQRWKICHLCNTPRTKESRQRQQQSERQGGKANKDKRGIIFATDNEDKASEGKANDDDNRTDLFATDNNDIFASEGKANEYTNDGNADVDSDGA